MLRITQYIKDTLHRNALIGFQGTILIWNLTNRCNLYCKHCYSFANQSKTDELLEEEIHNLIPQLREIGVKFAILSGGEPLLREDVFAIATKLKEEGIKTYLSTNGLLIDENNIDSIKEHFDYVGISIDGEPDVHDIFRGKRGAFERSIQSIRLLKDKGVKVGVRFTLTPFTQKSLTYIFDLVEGEGIQKLYVSHLVYSGRGKRLSDLERQTYRSSVDFIISKAFEYVEKGKDIEVVTGNNEADAVLLYQKFKERYGSLADDLYQRLMTWGGNQAGVRLLNIDYKGNVKPDPFFQHSLGNVKEKKLKEIWNGNGLLSFLRERPRKVKGKCENCNYIQICNGNSRARAYAVFSDYTQEDPACYL